MTVTFGEILIWLIVGGLTGSFVGMLATRSKKGFGHITNLGLGVGGALLGAVVFELFNIDLGLGDLSVSFEDLISAFVGSVVVLAIVWAVRRYRKPRSPGSSD